MKVVKSHAKTLVSFLQQSHIHNIALAWVNAVSIPCREFGRVG